MTFKPTTRDLETIAIMGRAGSRGQDRRRAGHWRGRIQGMDGQACRGAGADADVGGAGYQRNGIRFFR
jgi:hypothetical protein